VDGSPRRRKAIGKIKKIILKYIVEVSCSEKTHGTLLLFNGYCILYGVKAAGA
jgi:hypothetical protein